MFDYCYSVFPKQDRTSHLRVTLDRSKTPEFHLKGLKPLELVDMTSNQLEEVRQDIKLAVLVLGSIEQHGPNTALETDLAMALEMTRMLSSRMYPQVLVMPPIPWGMSAYHMDFPGTITLRPETILALLRNLYESIRSWGIECLLIANFHSGNESIINTAVQQLSYEYKPKFLGAIELPVLEPDNIEAQMQHSEFVGHGCEIETSELMYVRPDLVRVEEISEGSIHNDEMNYRRGARSKGLRTNWSFKSITENGALGDARTASYEAGRSMVDAMVDSYEELVRQIINTHNPSPAQLENSKDNN